MPLTPYEKALQIWLSAFSTTISAEVVEVASAAGRITAVDIHAPHSLPQFRRSMMDGFAVRSEDTFGFSASQPGRLQKIGEVLMGVDSGIELSAGQCVLIHTGGMLPQGADAVIKLEDTISLPNGLVQFIVSTDPGGYVIQPGEDVSKGDLVISHGSPLRSAEIGGLLALGITEVEVYSQPQIGILSSGDELVQAHETPGPGQVRDINTSMLASFVQMLSGIPKCYPAAPDNFEQFFALVSRAYHENDILVITAGSSASKRDLTARAINQLGTPGILVHGISVRPGKPTILADVNGKPVIGLPGNPVSALVIAELFIKPMILKYSGVKRIPPNPVIQAKLLEDIPASPERDSWVAIKLVYEDGVTFAQPIFGKSNLIFTLARADGLIRIRVDSKGYSKEELIHMELFQWPFN
ncbi:MAG: molybdopterin molybdotransferase MoeA [Anaerolineales bacterium]|nr:molybdopterin molybdotransferase MoeA [Anaerolineales bacterium]